VKRFLRVKKLDGHLISSFIPPFVLATFIALFVLIMQTLWLYIDDILGKGANLIIVLEFLFYLSMSLIPLALPIGVLLASVMLFGNLGENYELSSMKSAGISLFRIMTPLIFLTAGIALTSFVFNEIVIPYSNLKFKSRLYDLRKTSPTLNLEAGVFNDDFTGYVIYIGAKGEKGRVIEDVLIYDHQNTSSKGETNIIRAKSGEMYASEDNNFFIMKLKDGNMYQEMQKGGSKSASKYPFLRSSFQEWTKVFDLRQFDMNRTDEDLFKSNQSMKNSGQLRSDIDSMKLRIEQLNYSSLSGLSSIQTIKSNEAVNQTATKGDDPKNSEDDVTQQDKEDQLKEEITGNQIVPKQDPAKELSATSLAHIERRRQLKARTPNLLFVQDTFSMDTITSLLQTFPASKRLGMLNRMENEVKVSKQRFKNNQGAIESLGKKVIKHIYELNIKYSFAIVCIIFLFIGAPMGAIVRKGGFGYPLLISIFFFIIFILLTIFCKKLAESTALAPTLAAWVPALSLAPIGLLLTYKAMNDSKFVDTNRIMNIIRAIRLKRSKGE
jgi:lipopolysaccharide export system permease protein